MDSMNGEPGAATMTAPQMEKPSFRDVLKQTSEAGKAHRQETAGRFLGGLKEKFKGLNEARKKVANVLGHAWNIGEAVAVSDEHRKLLAEACSNKVQEAKDSVKQKTIETGNAIRTGVEEAGNRASAAAREVGQTIQAEVIQPSVDTARAVGKGIRDGATAGALFVAEKTIINPVMSTVRTVEAVGQYTRNQYESGKQTVVNAVDSAERAGRLAVEHVNVAANNAALEINARRYDLQATLYENRPRPGKAIKEAFVNTSSNILEGVGNWLNKGRLKVEEKRMEVEARQNEIRSKAVAQRNLALELRSEKMFVNASGKAEAPAPIAPETKLPPTNEGFSQGSFLQDMAPAAPVAPVVAAPAV